MGNWKHVWVSIVAALALAMVGCMGGAGPEGASAGESPSELLVAEDDGLEQLDAAEWSAAQPGCEGLLSGGEHFAVASAEHGLVAVLDADGEVVCVDTVESVEEELEETGREDEADDLVMAFMATVAANSAEARSSSSSSRFGGATREGDPDPEPNLGWNILGRMRGDPDPEPNCGS